jgi:hypothetical protein
VDKSRYNIFLLVFRLSKYDNDICVNGEVIAWRCKDESKNFAKN